MREETRSFPDLVHRPRRSDVSQETDRFARGSLFGRYVVLHQIGSGGNGIVYAAWDPELDRRVAIKILRPEFQLGAASERQRAEARALARFRHPNIVSIYDIGDDGGRTFIAMEFVDGPTLADWLLAEPARPWQEIVDVFLQAGKGLDAAHRNRLVHRDFKPSNVMIDGRGVARVTDFGLAGDLREADGDDAEPVARRRAAGTPGYVAPECFAGRVDAASDQFSYCVSLHRSLLGVAPFSTADQDDHIDAIHAGETLRETPGRRVPGWLRRIVQRGMAADAEQRYASMADLIADLNPQRRRARIGRFAAFVAVPVLIALGWLLRPTENATCSPPTEKLAGVWDDPRRLEIRSAFETAAPVLGPGTWIRVERALEPWTARWLEQHVEACTATYIQGDQSEHMLDLRMTCLDSRLDTLRSVTDLLTQADQAMVIGAVDVVARLGSLADCTDRAELALLTPLPTSPETRKRVETLRARVEGALIEVSMSRPVDLEAVDKDLETLRTLHYPPLEGRTLLLRALLQIHQEDDFEAGARTLEEALRASIAAGDRVLQARVLGLLVEVHGYYLGDHERADWWRRFAVAALDSLGAKQRDTESTLQSTLALYALSRGNFAEAEERLRRTLDIDERVWGTDDPRLVSTLINLAVVLQQLGERSEEGLAVLRRSMNITSLAWGEDHPAVAQTRVNLAAHLAETGRYSEAIGLTEAAHELMQRRTTASEIDRAYPLYASCFIWVAMDRPQRALEALAHVMPILSRIMGEEHPLYAQALHVRGESHFLSERFELAWNDLEAAERIQKASLPAEHPSLASLHITMARVALERNDRARAWNHLAASNAALAKGTTMTERDRILLELTAARLEEGDMVRDRLQRLLGSLDPAFLRSERASVAEARFLLAHQLASSDSEAARKEARAALASLRDPPAEEAPVSARSQRLGHDIAIWLEGADPARAADPS